MSEDAGAKRGGPQSLLRARTGMDLLPARMPGRARAWEDRRVRPTVLIVEDHAEFRASAAELLDVQLPDQDGFAVAARLAEEARPPQVVLISGRDAGAYGRRVPAAPVRGFLVKRDLTGAALAALVT